ncbi:MAG: hypothetical protein Q4D82_01520 [Neisseria sp.]|nr:hypothetical protein [Neisseria sp.]
MPDITMCLIHNCPKKAQCRRYTARPKAYVQSYFVHSPTEYTAARENRCAYFFAKRKERE